MYPEIRRASEQYDKFPTTKKGSNLEKNRSDVFEKAPSLSKNLFGRVKKDIAHPNIILAQDLKRKQIWALAALGILFCLSFLGIITFWFTNAFQNHLLSELLLKNNTETYTMFLNPTPKLVLKFHIFNYTNAKEFESGEEEKLRVEDIGPYAFEETLERLYPEFSDNNNFISYQEKRTYKFLPDLSKGKDTDNIVVPNMLLMAAAAVKKDSSLFERLALSGIFKGTESTAFLTTDARSLIVGYEDQLYSWSKTFMRFNNQKPAELFGLLSRKNGLQHDVLKVNTGIKNLQDLQKIQSINDEQLGLWQTEKCNDFHLTDGVMFNYNDIQHKSDVKFFARDICRAIPLKFQEEIKIFGEIPAYRYSMPMDVFDHAEKNTENQCYCTSSGQCPKQGLFNATLCSNGAPMFVSFPHFYRADESLLQTVDGLKPGSAPVETFVDIHPVMGYPIQATTRFQLNIQVLRSFGIPQLASFEDGAILPVSWFEIALEESRIPPDFKDIIYLTSITVKIVEGCLKYGTIIMSILTLIPLLLNLRKKWEQRERASSVKALKPVETV